MTPKVYFRIMYAQIYMSNFREFNNNRFVRGMRVLRSVAPLTHLRGEPSGYSTFDIVQ